jgi:hypothetical protein
VTFFGALYIRCKYPTVQKKHLSFITTHFLDADRLLPLQSFLYIQAPIDVFFVLWEVFQMLRQVVRPLRFGGACGGAEQEEENGGREG